MREILFVKTSSLGDVIHHMPAVTDAARHCPDARIGWMVEENYAPLVRLHPAVTDVIAVAVRRWRRHPFARATWRDVAEALSATRRRRYDTIVDTQGLLRSGLLARTARGSRHGYARESIREPLASSLYDVRHAIDRNLHAVERNRLLTAAALGYATVGPADYGLGAAGPADRAGSYAVFLHGSARAAKQWPEERWATLGVALSAEGYEIVLPWGSEEEGARSRRIEAAVPRARVPERQPLDRLARIIRGATIVVGVDTGLLHLAAAYAVPLVAIFTGSDPTLTGPCGSGMMRSVGTKGSVPQVAEVLYAVRNVVASERENRARMP